MILRWVLALPTVLPFVVMGPEIFSVVIKVVTYSSVSASASSTVSSATSSSSISTAA